MGSDCLASWLAKAFAVWWLTTMAFGAVWFTLGIEWALAAAIVIFAYLVGFLHGAGAEISKREAATSTQGDN